MSTFWGEDQFVTSGFYSKLLTNINGDGGIGFICLILILDNNFLGISAIILSGIVK
jgi:hypothetical protein